MGGRVYDPLAGRFTTADPITQAPFWSQGLNRYAYVFNDPLNNTDPSGYKVDRRDLYDSTVNLGTYTAAAAVGFAVSAEFSKSGLAAALTRGITSTGVAVGLGNAGVGALRDLLTGTGPGAAKPGGQEVRTAAPSATAKANTAPNSPYAAGQTSRPGGTMGAVRERAPLRLPDIPRPQGSDLRTADVGSCVFNPQACALALEQAVVQAVPWILRILPAVEGAAAGVAVGSEAIVLAPLFIPGDSGPTWIKAPGIPTAGDGFVPPKNWDGRPVPNPNGDGVGFPDDKGRVWIPTGRGPLGHGGPHWDVQKPGGGYDNVYPGGKIRPGKK